MAVSGICQLPMRRKDPAAAAAAAAAGAEEMSAQAVMVQQKPRMDPAESPMAVVEEQERLWP